MIIISNTYDRLIFHRKQKTLSSLVLLKVVIVTTYCAANEDKVVKLTIFVYSVILPGKTDFLLERDLISTHKLINERKGKLSMKCHAVNRFLISNEPDTKGR